MIPRSKSNSSTTISDYTAWCQTLPSGPITDHSGTEQTGQSRFTMDGYDLERYAYRRKRGELLPYTPYTNLEVEDISHVLSYDFTKDDETLRCVCIDRGFQSAFLSDSDVTSLVDDVDLQPFVNSAAASIYASGHDTLTFLSELHKTVKLFTQAGQRLRDLLKNGDIGSSWLEYRYGWRILYYDIISLQKAINNLNGSRKRYSQRMGSSYSDSNTFEIESPVDPTGAGDIFARVDDHWTVSLRGSVIADISPPEFRFDPISTAWELVKFSFIIDWFIQIGQWLQSMNFLMYQSKYYAAGGVKLTLTRSVSTSRVVPNTGWANFAGSVSGRSSATLIIRTPTTVSTFPQIRVNLDTAKILDLLAIAYKSFR